MNPLSILLHHVSYHIMVKFRWQFYCSHPAINYFSKDPSCSLLEHSVKNPISSCYLCLMLLEYHCFWSHFYEYMDLVRFPLLVSQATPTYNSISLRATVKEIASLLLKAVLSLAPSNSPPERSRCLRLPMDVYKFRSVDLRLPVKQVYLNWVCLIFLTSPVSWKSHIIFLEFRTLSPCHPGRRSSLAVISCCGVLIKKGA